jgi:ketosteroid isomerase-like protein
MEMETGSKCYRSHLVCLSIEYFLETPMTTSVDTVLRFYDALGRGDVPAVLGLMHRQIEWTEAERFPYYGGTWHGPEAVLSNLLVPLSRDWEGFSARADDFITDGERVVSLGVYSGTYRKTGRSFSAPFAHIWTVRGDKLTRFQMYTDTAKVLEALAA